MKLMAGWLGESFMILYGSLESMKKSFDKKTLILRRQKRQPVETTKSV